MPDAKQSWRLRQSALYHRYNLDAQESVLILISPRKNTAAESSCIKALKSLHEAGSAPSTQLSPFALDQLFVESYLGNWKLYLRHYERKIQDVVSKQSKISWRLLTDTKKSCEVLGARREGTTLDASPSQLYEIEEALLPLEPTLTNLEKTFQSFEELLKHVLQRSAVKRPKFVQCTEDFVTQLSRERMRIQMWTNNAIFLLRKHAAVAQLLDSTVALQRNDLMTELTQSTVDDSGTVRVIGAITLIFLPMTAVGVSWSKVANWSNADVSQTIMSMPLFDVNETSKTLTVSPDVWKFFAFAVPLTMITLIFWRIEAWRMHKKRQRVEIEACSV